MERLRLAELMAALSLATDLGMGQPMEQALRTCLIAVSLGDRLGLSRDELSEVYYVALLRFLGCTADAHEFAAMVGGDDISIRAAIAPVLGGTRNEFASQVMPKVGAGKGPLRRAQLLAGMLSSGEQQGREGVRAGCELAVNLAGRIGLPSGVRRGLASAFETWSGTGFPDGIGGEAIPLSSRLVFVARDAEILQRRGGDEAVKAAMQERGGVTYDPSVAAAFLSNFDALMDSAAVVSPWDAVLEREPEPHPWVPESRLDPTLEAFADFVDMKSPFTAGHSREVAALASDTSAADADGLRRAGLVHDLGRVSVPNGIWDKPAKLTDGEWERVRLHPYYSERIVGRVARLEPLARLAGMHHERMDGSGYHRGSERADIPSPARVLAAADAYQAMTQPRPHRPARTRDEAAEMLRADARAGRLDVNAVDDVLSAAGHRSAPVRRVWPAGLSEREVEVLRLICRGGTKKQAAALLRISPSTVDHHVRHIYDKVGVATRAGATLFAVENDLLQ
ncbi:MAG TPA: HD domain-containing phosphohydrolase [Candidatus Dormibacteraeota bacterium]|nr:HD domain-containing phosphohydrolase [Candidatus Dormibacteraeota bacterium]